MLFAAKDFKQALPTDQPAPAPAFTPQDFGRPGVVNAPQPAPLGGGFRSMGGNTGVLGNPFAVEATRRQNGLGPYAQGGGVGNQAPNPLRDLIMQALRARAQGPQAGY